MCNLCTPRPIHRSTYRPTLDRYVGRHIDRQSAADISTEICRSRRHNFNRTIRILRAEHCNLRKTYDTIPLQWYKKVNFHPDSISPPLQRTLSFPIFDKFAMVFGYCLWRSTSRHLFDQPPTRNRRRYRHQQAKWIHWTSYRKFLTEGFRRTIRSECLHSLSLSCHTPFTPTAAMLSVYKKKMPSGSFKRDRDTSYMEHNRSHFHFRFIKTSFPKSSLLQTFLLKIELVCRISRISHRSSHLFGVERTKNLMFKRAPSKIMPLKTIPNFER